VTRDIEKEIDHRLQLRGTRLGQEAPGQRDRVRRDIELDEARHVSLAASIREEEEQLRRRFIHHTRKKGPLSLEDAIDLAERMAGRGQ
jgi:hypothetical protein